MLLQLDVSSLLGRSPQQNEDVELGVRLTSWLDPSLCSEVDT
jgi:hypothetical protein